MATIKFGAIVTDGRGKINGSQLSKNRSGNILQNKCQQRKGATIAQSSFRSKFGAVARHWRSLSADDQAANNAATVNYPYTDKYGATRYFSGYQLLLRSNLNLAVSGYTPINVVPITPPLAPVLTDVNFGVIIISPSELLAEWEFTTDATTPNDWFWQLFIGSPVSTGVTNYSGKWLFYKSAILSSFQAVPENLFPTYVPNFSAGQRIFSRLVVMDVASGVEVVNLLRYDDY